MSTTIVLKKGLDIPISGESELRVSKTIAPGIVAVCPTDFKGLLPRLLVKEGDPVLCGSPVIADKKNPDIILTSPVSGTVKELVRGDKRKLLAVLIEADDEQKCVDFGTKDVDGMDADAVRQAILHSVRTVSSQNLKTGPATSSSPQSVRLPSLPTASSASQTRRRRSRLP